jgi:hypothetical protein
MASYVFISYSRADRAYVYGLAAHLHAAGVPVWYDYQIETGDSFAHRIQEKIEGCAAFVPVLTPLAAASPWVQREISYADELGKPILPLILVDCRKPLLLVGVQHEDVTGSRMPPPRFEQQLRGLLGTGTTALPPRTPAATAQPRHPVPALRLGRPSRPYKRRRGLLVGAALTLFLAAATATYVVSTIFSPLDTSVTAGPTTAITSSRPTITPSTPTATLPSGTFAMPNVSGRYFEHARQVVRDLKLGSIIVFEGNDPGNLSVRATDPAAGTPVRQGDRVQIFVPGSAPSTTMPSVVGLTCSQAASSIVNAGLYPLYQSARAGRVRSQSPSAGTSLHWNDSATISCVSGPTTPSTR